MFAIPLTKKHCVPGEGGTPSLTTIEENKYKKEVNSWDLLRGPKHKLKKEFHFKNFKDAMIFVNGIANIAEQEGHHPDIYIFYNKVNIELYTPAVNGLSESNFIMAAKIEDI